MVIVTVTTHYYDGKKSFPIEIKFYQHSSSLAKGKDIVQVPLIPNT
jgi:hypothetical protein